VVLPKMPSIRIREYTQSLAAPWMDLAAVTLTDGQAIVGHIGGSPEVEVGEGQVPAALSNPSQDRWHFFQNDKLVLSHRGNKGETRIYVPFAAIANLSVAPFTQTVYSEYVDFDIDWSDARERLMAEYLRTYNQGERSLRRKILEFQAAQRHIQFERFKEGLAGDSSLTDSDLEVSADWLTNEFKFLDRRLQDVLEVEAVQTASRHGYQVRRYVIPPTRFDITIKGTVTLIGDVDAPSRQLIYADYDLLSRSQGGPRGVSGGFVVSFGVEWDQSLERHVKKELHGPITPFADVCSQRAVRIQGHVAFVSATGSVIEDAEVPQLESVRIEGGDWYAGVISQQPLAGPPPDGIPWILSYWNSQTFLLPYMLLDRVTRPLRIYGEVVNSPAVTSFGKCKCFIKVYCAETD
jgi:hypothetical protein